MTNLLLFSGTFKNFFTSCANLKPQKQQIYFIPATVHITYISRGY